MTNSSDFAVLAIEIEYIKNTLDEIRKDHLPAIRREVRQAILDEYIPLEERVSEIEQELKVIDRRVWAMFGGLGLVIPALISTLIALSVSYLISGGIK